MNLYTKIGDNKNNFITGLGISKTEVIVKNKQKNSETKGNRINRIENKKDYQFNLCTRFEKIEANKKARNKKYELSRLQSKGEKRF
jgi:hypothetical protein